MFHVGCRLLWYKFDHLPRLLPLTLLGHFGVVKHLFLLDTVKNAEYGHHHLLLHVFYNLKVDRRNKSG